MRSSVRDARQLEELAVAGRVELQHGRAELKPCVHSVQPARPVASFDREDRRAVRGAPGGLERTDLRGRQLEHAVDRRQQASRGEARVDAHHGPTTTMIRPGPWIPSVKVSSMSAVRLGPLMTVHEAARPSAGPSVRNASASVATISSRRTTARCTGGRSETVREHPGPESRTSDPVSATAASQPVMPMSAAASCSRGRRRRSRRREHRRHRREVRSGPSSERAAPRCARALRCGRRQPFPRRAPRRPARSAPGVRS